MTAFVRLPALLRSQFFKTRLISCAVGAYVEITGEIAYNSKDSGGKSIGISTLKIRILN